MAKTNDPQSFRVHADSANCFDLSEAPTKVKKLYSSRKDYEKLIKEGRDRISSLQRILYAHSRYSILIIFQAIDAAGKDGAIRHVLSGVNPQGCRVASFKRPSERELNHDFMWRTVKELPERGHIGVFNRSYYEEVLVVRVNEAILQGQRLPRECMERPELWQERFRDIVNFEDYLVRNGTRVIKFFLHLSKEEQRQRFLSRIETADKNWKMVPDDIKVRNQWDEYQSAFEDCLRNTSHPAAQWHAVPADDKRNARLIISQIIVEEMEKLKIAYPEPTEEHLQQLKGIEKVLRKEGKS